MVVNMVIGAPAGDTDRVLDFSTAITGSLFFVPGAAFLDDPPPPCGAFGRYERANSSTPTEDTIALTEPVAVVEDEGSLGIGSLKGA
jgi:porphyrinogen peroxidase